MSLSEPVLRRLGLIKHLYQEGAEQSQEEGRLASTAVLSFHDAVEWFLYLVAEHTGVNIPSRINFMDYWENLSGLGHKAAMNRLNEARKALKHRGSFPSEQDVDELRVSVRAFFEDHTPQYFDLSFEDVSLVLLITNDEVRQLLEEAQENQASGHFEEAIVAAAKAMYEVMRGARARANRLLRFPEFSSRDLERLPDHANFARTLRRELNAIEEAVQLVYMGVDFRRYAGFERLTPSISRAHAGNWQVRWTGSKPNLTEGDVDFCITFVVETALQTEQS